MVYFTSGGFGNASGRMPIQEPQEFVGRRRFAQPPAQATGHIDVSPSVLGASWCSLPESTQTSSMLEYAGFFHRRLVGHANTQTHIHTQALQAVSACTHKVC